MITQERFARGMTFAEYVTYAGSPENLAREGFGGRTCPTPDRWADRARTRARCCASATPGRGSATSRPRPSSWLAARPGGPAKLLVISEDWSSDCRRDVPVLARLAEAGGIEMRIFNRDGKKILGARRPDPAAHPDGNHDLMLEFLNDKNGGAWASLPVAVFYTADLRELHRYIEYPAIYHKDRIRGHQQAARPGESARRPPSGRGRSSPPSRPRRSSTCGRARRWTRS